MKPFFFVLWLFGASPAEAGEPYSPKIIALSASDTVTCALLGDRTDSAGPNHLACWGSQETLKNSIHWNRSDSDRLVSGGDATCVLGGDSGACYGPRSFSFSFQNLIAAAAGPENRACFHDAAGLRCLQPALRSSILIWDANVPKLSEVSELAVGDDFACAISNAELLCWSYGKGYSYPVNPAPRVTNPRHLTAGGYTACAVGEEGLVCWAPHGGDFEGALPSLKNPRALSVNNKIGCALDDEGVKCWGPELRDVPKLKNPRLLAVGKKHACAVVKGDLITCWGDNTFGQTEPPAYAFGMPTKQYPAFVLDRIAPFFQLVSQTSTPAFAKFFASLAQVAEITLPFHEKNGAISRQRFFLALLAWESLENWDSAYGRAEISSKYLGWLEGLAREFSFPQPYLYEGMNVRWEPREFYKQFSAGDPILNQLALQAALCALRTAGDFTSPAQQPIMGALLRAAATAASDPQDVTKTQIFLQTWAAAAPFLETLRSNPKSSFLIRSGSRSVWWLTQGLIK
jgi:hypothetical protein